MLSLAHMVPRDDDPWKRLREREDEENDDSSSLAAKRGAVRPGSGQPQAASEGKLDQLLEQAGPLIEQLNNLYNQYFAGAERNPPNERRKHLDQIMASIQLTHKPTAAIQFRCQTVHSAYITARDRWDRMLKDLETGKLKRTR